tara:strand:+ start:546 stop:1286 length:741 start_codon:yes stop_codon:yes gene_type:complete
MKTDIVTGMHRTGHHAVAVWLSHQFPGISNFSFSTVASWLMANETDKSLILMANNPLREGRDENPDKKKLPLILNDVKPQNLIITHEQERLERLTTILQQSPYSINKPIVVIRDFRNWVASCIKMALRDNKIIEEVISYEKIEMYHNHIKNFWNDDYYFILYNKWATDKNYREEICKYLEYFFTDAAKEQLSIFGGGSSFDALDYLKNASDMDVNNRYQEMEKHPYYETILEKYQGTLRLSNRIFK